MLRATHVAGRDALGHVAEAPDIVCDGNRGKKTYIIMKISDRSTLWEWRNGTRMECGY